MSWNHNHFSIVGRLTRDPELSYTQQNKAMARFSIACNAGGGNGKEDVADFFDVTAWEKTAELVQQYLHKGSKVLISGRMRQERWTDKATGQNRSKVTLTAREVEFLDSKPASNDQGGGMPGGYTKPAAQDRGYDSNPAGRPGGAPINREAARRPATTTRQEEDEMFERSFQDNPPPDMSQPPPDEDVGF